MSARPSVWSAAASPTSSQAWRVGGARAHEAVCLPRVYRFAVTSLQSISRSCDSVSLTRIQRRRQAIRWTEHGFGQSGPHIRARLRCYLDLPQPLPPGSRGVAHRAASAAWNAKAVSSSAAATSTTTERPGGRPLMRIVWGCLAVVCAETEAIPIMLAREKTLLDTAEKLELIDSPSASSWSESETTVTSVRTRPSGPSASSGADDGVCPRPPRGWAGSRHKRAYVFHGTVTAAAIQLWLRQ